MPRRLASVRVRQPADYMSPCQTDALHADVLTWLRGLPSVKLAGWRRLATWSAGVGHPPPVWAWLSALAPYVQVCLRAIRLTSAVAARERPVAWALIGVGGDLNWQAPLIAEAMALASPAAMNWTSPRPPSAIPEAAAPKAPVPNTSAPRLAVLLQRWAPIWTFRRLKSYRSAVQRLVQSTPELLGDDFDGHVVLLSRSQRGTQWFFSRALGRPMLIDDYSEGMPDAFAEACVRRNWRLTLIWEGVRPTVNGVGYAERWPDHVKEIPLSAFGTIATKLRKPAQARYTAAVDRLFRDPAMLAAFRLDGVDIFTPHAHHLTRILIDLSVLMTTQSEAWRLAFEALSPNVVVSGRLENRPWINSAAAASGARSVSIKLGVGDEMALSLMAVRPNGAHEARSSPDALLVWGEHQVRHIQHRLPENTAALVPIGRLRSDTFVRESGSVDPAATRAALGLKPSGPVIVWGGTCRSRWALWPGQVSGGAVMSAESWVECLKALCVVAQRHGGQVLVKPHPADDQAFVAAQARRMGPEICVLAIDASVHNHELLAATDVFVSSVSSMFAEALLAGKAAVNVWTPEIAFIYETARFDLYSRIAAPARSAEAAAVIVDRLLSDPAAYADERSRAMEALPELFGPVDGLNAQQAAEWVLDFGGGPSR